MPSSDTLLYGYHAVAEAIRAGRRKIGKVYVAGQKRSDRREKIVALARETDIRVERLSPEALSTMLGLGRHQGFAAEVSAYPLVDFKSLVPTDDEAPLLLVLDHIVDPQNFGAMVRTALCAGVRGVIIAKDRCAPPSAAVSKASAGALEHMRVVSVTNVAASLQALKKAGVWIAGADRDGQVALFQADLRGPLAVVIGSEEKGLRPLVKKQCDYLVAIPQTGPIGSLNASVAAGVLLYEAFRQRHEEKAALPSG